MKLVSCMVVVAASFLLPACQVATPAARIEEHPALYNTLSEADKAMVQQGRIRSGMTRNAVFLAWGKPHTEPYVGEKSGKKLERWVYTRLEPVDVLPNWSAHAWCRDFAPLPDTAYVNRPTAYVLFEDGKVTAWEALR